MAKKSSDYEKASATLSPAQVVAAIPKVQTRLDELRSVDINQLENDTGEDVLASLCQKINTTLRGIYGSDTIEYTEYYIDGFMPTFAIITVDTDFSVRGNLDRIRKKVNAGIAMLETLLDILGEQAGPSEEDVAGKSLRAYAGLDLHPEIARASSQLFRDGHYATSVEASVKALNSLVRHRSGLEFDGNTLMERAFSVKNPVLKFNGLQNQSDLDEQKGYMQMFCGAVSGLRNPRAHGFIHDKPERALEFIAFVSLLAKLLDEATK